MLAAMAPNLELMATSFGSGAMAVINYGLFGAGDHGRLDLKSQPKRQLNVVSMAMDDG